MYKMTILDQKNMLLIGATASNLGKTELACELIRRFSRDHRIIAVKVTTVTERDGLCPRGGQGCGVCSSLEGDFCITHETEGPERKDTMRMLHAGATDVYWLRVMEAHLYEGYMKLREYFTDDDLIICESNRLRLVAEPGLFIMVRDKRTGNIKPSSEKVISLADQSIYFDGSGFDFSPDRIVYGERGWEILP